MHRKWLVNRTNQDFLEYLARKTSVSTAFVQILVNRGLKDPDSIKAFLNPSIDDLHDPFLMPDMKTAVERIRTAVDRNETVFVHGDYDADGITSTALLVSALRGLGLKTHYYIPNRLSEGYGFNMPGIQKARQCGAGLVITVDCGISSEKEVSEANSSGMDVIVTDHHEPPLKLPPALAVINPHRTDSAYPFKYLAGVGVVYKLVQALTQPSTLNLHPSSFLDLAAIGTIADSVPLTGENRVIAAYGLKELNGRNCRLGIHALMEASGINNGRELKSETLSYTVIPRINAAGRLGDASEVVELFLTTDEARAKGIAAFLSSRNKDRQRIEEEVYKSAVGMIDADNPGSAIVLHSPAWHQGVLGIVASRLVEEFYRPAFVFSVDGDTAKGSARSIPPFHIYKGIAECSGLLLGFGGHSQAAGVRILTENLPAFKKQINSIVERDLNDEALTPVLEIDAGVELFEVTFNLVKELGMLEPFGSANEPPLLGVKGIEAVDPRVVGSSHLKMRLKQKSLSIDTIGFNMSDLLEKIEGSYALDAAFVPCINEWNNSRILQLNLKAVRPST